MLAALALAADDVREDADARAIVDASGYAGTVIVRDLDNGGYVAGHAELADRQVIPASTFKIFNSLVALETGVVASPQAVIKWDGVVRERKELNRDLDLKTAFRLSAVPHYQEIARRIGQERMQSYVDKTGYGNRDISGGIDQFWLDGGLRISPRQQVDFLARLYRDDLPFSKRTMAMVREIMINEQTPAYTLRAKTGWGIPEPGHDVGWWVGWVEGDTGAHAFAGMIETDARRDDFITARITMTRNVLVSLGILHEEP